MSKLISIPGLNVEVAYDRDKIATAAAEKVANAAYRMTYAFTDKALGDSEKVVEAGIETKTQAVKAATIAKENVIAAVKVTAHKAEATIDDAIAEATSTSKRVTQATGVKLQHQFDTKVGNPVVEQYAKIRARQVDAHDNIRQAINEYCDGPTIQLSAQLMPALPEATTAEVAKPKLSKKVRKAKTERSLSDLIVEEMA